MKILLYHDIDTLEDPSEKTDIASLGTVVSLGEFKSHMEYLSDKGFNVISVARYLEKINDNSISPTDIVLTFDDGHVSNYIYALPVLKQYSFSATFFIIANQINEKYYMTSHQLQELRKNGMEIGSHGLTHTWLPLLDSNDIEYEIEESRKKIEIASKGLVKTFAYPGGHYTDFIVKSVRKNGYAAALSCILGINKKDTEPYLLKRIEIRKGTSKTDFQKALNPLSISIYTFIDRVKRVIKQIAGLKRYEKLRHNLYSLYPFKR